MGIGFAEKIIDGMVDENGHCGERGISRKQYEVLHRYLTETEAEKAGGWAGDMGGYVDFYEWDEVGVIGKYRVKLNCFDHFNLRVTVESIDRWIDEVPTFEDSEWVGEIKERRDFDLTLIRDYRYERPAYTYGYETAHIYTLADDEGNCFVWKTTSWLDWNPRGNIVGGKDYVQAVPGDRVTLRATVKEHGEYRGIKQTVITRPKVEKIAAR